MGISAACADAILTTEKAATQSRLWAQTACASFLQALPKVDLSPSDPEMLSLSVLCNVFFPTLLSDPCGAEENVHSFSSQC